jgi:type IV pilus assembly protein PilB
MAISDTDLGTILLEQNYVSQEELTKAQDVAKKGGQTLKNVLVEMGLLTQELFDSAVAEYYKLPYYDIHALPPAPQLINAIPESIARHYRIAIVQRTDNDVTIATSDPGNPFMEEALRLNIDAQTALFPAKDESAKNIEQQAGAKSAGSHFPFIGGSKKQEERGRYGGNILFVYAPNTIIEALFAHYRKPLATRFQAIIEQQKKVAPEIIIEIFNDAIDLRASDIHFEPQEAGVIVRFRVDGVMHEAGRLQKEHYEGVVNRIKIESNMQIDSHFAAQDGAIRYKTKSGNSLDMRVSIVPVVDGEKIVIRLLSEYVRTLTLQDLGFNEEYRQILELAAHKPFGMILTTGPTGAGKSTTLYALLKMRNSPDVNISTIEDPVEYKIPGINHIQVNPETELTFAKGLRALVRQDPNIILVGEIRDGETASIAVNAALTGHLLFSTLHANDAPTAVPRLLEMGVEPFLLASTLEVIIGQRLVRRICPSCRYSYDLSLDQATKLFPGADKYFLKKEDVRLYRGKGCEACGNTGFRGRVGIYELLVITPEIQELIIHRASANDITKQGAKQGLKMLFDDGFAKVQAGQTTIEELLRVAAPPELLFAHAERS